MREATGVIVEVARRLEALGLSYVIGGSVASIAHGEPRTTEDVDFVVEGARVDGAALVRAFEPDFYVDRVAVDRAVKNRSSFNMIHLQALLKVDIFVSSDDEFGRRQLERRVAVELESGAAAVWIASPEDTVVAKLRWYRKGGGVPDRQWRDILGVLKQQRSNLDLAYLQRFASVMQLEDLLRRALTEAGLAEPT